MFRLHAQLEKDTVPIGDLALCRVLLMNNASYPWVILVPKREDVSEIFQLTAQDRQQLMVEMSEVSAALAAHYRADKMNVAALGNVVPQLHVHVIARYQDDPAWPRPVWGGETRAYAEDVLAATVAELGELLEIDGLDPV
jgi:diadenosine tetraphosphate (Ap4A) HIT family hydrolase